MKKNKIITAVITGALLIASAPCAFAESADLVKSYEYEAESAAEKKEVKKEIKEDGKTYRLVNVEYEVISDNEITETRKVKTNSKKRYKKKIEHTLPDGSSVSLHAAEAIDWKEIRQDEVTETRQYKSYDEIPELIRTTKETDEGTIDIRLELTSVDEASRREAFTVPALFKATAEDVNKYKFNGKNVVVTGDSPAWEGYEEEVKAYLDLLGNDYTIEGGRWEGEKTLVDGRYIRNASFFGTKVVPFFTATFVESADTARLFTAEVRYTGYAGNVKMKAIAYYERILGTREKVMIGAAVFILAIAIATLLYFLSRRRKRDLYG